VQVCTSGATSFPKVVNRSLINQKHHVQPTAVTNVNICQVKELLLENRQTEVHDIASKVCVSVGSAETIIHEYYCSRKCVHGRSQKC
jgi:hypothetical protein